MNAAYKYTEKLTQTVSYISKRFFLPAEFAQSKPDAEARELLRAFSSKSGASFSRDAYMLTGKQREKLLLAADEELSDTEFETLCALIKQLATPRLAILFWACFQFHHRSPRYLKIAKIFVDSIDDEKKKCREIENLALSTGASGPARLAAKMSSEHIFISTFTENERICAASPFYEELLTEFFRSCTAEGFLLNEKRFISLLFERSDSLPVDIVSNYLDALNEEQYFFDVNNMLLERWGNPFSSPDWHDIAPLLKRKFINWTSYKKLVMHFPANRLKLSVLSLYIPYVREIYLYCDNRVMIMDFGDFFVADDSHTAPFSYYFSQNTYMKFQEKITQNELTKVRQEIEKIPHGRDFIIEEVEGDFMQLDYEDVGRFYIRDMLDILLGIKPDLRASKLIVRNKNKRNRIRVSQ